MILGDVPITCKREKSISSIYSCFTYRKEKSKKGGKFFRNKYSPFFISTICYYVHTSDGSCTRQIAQVVHFALLNCNQCVCAAQLHKTILSKREKSSPPPLRKIMALDSTQICCSFLVYKNITNHTTATSKIKVLF